jgi:ribosomal protein L20
MSENSLPGLFLTVAINLTIIREKKTRNETKALFPAYQDGDGNKRNFWRLWVTLII